MDTAFITREGRFNYRVCAIILAQGRILAMHDQRSPYYYLPGGRVRLHERAEDAVLRELREELDIEAKIQRPLWMNQAFFTEGVTSERFHEICIYFLVDIRETDLLSRGDSFEQEEGGKRHQFQWLDICTLKDRYFYPVFLKEELQNLPETFTIRTEVE